jgi:hypothetical protein
MGPVLSKRLDKVSKPARQGEAATAASWKVFSALEIKFPAEAASDGKFLSHLSKTPRDKPKSFD